MFKEDVQAAMEHGHESESVEYKSSFDPTAGADWLEIIKDIVALANSGGGLIIFGVDDDGHLSGFDINCLIRMDPADLTNKMSKYTGQQFAGFEFLETERDSQPLFAILVHGVANPMVLS